MSNADLKFVKKVAKATLKECFGDDYIQTYTFMTTFGKNLAKALKKRAAQ